MGELDPRTGSRAAGDEASPGDDLTPSSRVAGGRRIASIAAAPEPSPARRHFLRQGQLAGAVIGGILAAILTGVLPPRMELVGIGPELAEVNFVDLLLWFGPLLIGMALGYIGWVMAFEHRRPSLLGRGWTAERDWAITGAVFVAFFLGRFLASSSSESATGLYPTGDPNVFLHVDAPVDIAITLVRYLATTGIAAVMLRLVFDAYQAARGRLPS